MSSLSSFVVPFSFHLQSFPSSGSFPMSQFFASGGQSIGTSASTSVLPNIQDWFPLGLTSLISLQSKGLSRVFSSTTVQKHQFFGARPSLWSNSHISTSVGTKKFPLHQGVPDSPLPHIVWPQTQQNADNREKPSGLLQFPKTCYWSQKTWDICLFLKII